MNRRLPLTARTGEGLNSLTCVRFMQDTSWGSRRVPRDGVHKACCNLSEDSCTANDPLWALASFFFLAKPLQLLE